MGIPYLIQEQTQGRCHEQIFIKSADKILRGLPNMLEEFLRKKKSK
jgi:hypothetical protein